VAFGWRGLDYLFHGPPIEHVLFAANQEGARLWVRKGVNCLLS